MTRAIQLFHRRWSVAVVGELYASGGMRFSELSASLDASRDTLSETLLNLIMNGLVMHEDATSDRPRYELTLAGRRVGEACIAAVDAAREAGIVRIALKKWPMLVLVALGRGATRYGEMQAALPGITSRSLAMALKDLQNAGLVDRTIGEGYPPRTMYRLTERSTIVFPAMDRLISACEGT
jgi:DNA-binding HxlR family transcriptional regulator